MELQQYYALYSDKQQTKLLSLASSMEKVKAETEYHTDGVWFEYDQKAGSNLLINERALDGIEFPKEAKQREYKNYGTPEKPKFKWVS